MAPPPPPPQKTPMLPIALSVIAVLLLLPSQAAAEATLAAPFDILKILAPYPEFSAFTAMVNDTGLARSINAQRTVTVLAANNTGLPVAALRRLPNKLLGDLLALHVVLDYLDPEKLDALRLNRTGQGSRVTTLLPGPEAKYLRVAGGDAGRITFSYAGPVGRGPAPRNATLVRVVTAQGFNAMVLQVDGLVLPAMMPAAVAAPFDVARILAGFPDFHVFATLLAQTGLARAINAHPVVTILAVNNTDLARALRGIPPRATADVLALHAVLDYLDASRLDALRLGRTGDGSLVTTMLQRPGSKGRGAGFVRITGGEDGRITFSSATTGAGGSRNATLVKVVTRQAFSVIVLQVCGLIVPPAPVLVVAPVPTPMPAPAPMKPRARHMSLPPAPGPAPAASIVMPEPEPDVPRTTAPPSAVIPIPSVHGGVAAKIPESAAGRIAAGSWSSVAGAAFGIMACLLASL